MKKKIKIKRKRKSFMLLFYFLHSLVKSINLECVNNDIVNIYENKVNYIIILFLVEIKRLPSRPNIITIVIYLN